MASTDTAPVILTRGLGKVYSAGTEAEVVALRGVDVRIERGEFVAIMGPSGSGKSTLMNLIGCLDTPTSGTYECDGVDVSTLDAEELATLRRDKIGFVFQGFHLLPRMNATDNVAMPLGYARVAPAERRQRALAALASVGLAERAGHRPNELSGGQQQRVAIAMAVATNPRILVLDEPTTALDVITQAAVLALVNDLRAQLGMAVLIVSHDLGVVSAVADDVLVMRDGREVEHGPTMAVLSSPTEQYTRELIEAAPRIEGVDVPEARDADADTVLRCRDVDIRYPHAPRLAVTGFNLEIRRGETVAIVGESGSGKSTVATALAGLALVENGEAVLWSSDGARHDLLGPAAKRPVDVRRSVQMIFQNADLALNPRRSIGDSVARPLTVFGRTKGRADSRERVAKLLTEVGLGPEFADRVPAQLSGGQRQRVGIARALAAGPSLLIADEITTALDVSVQASVLELLEE